MGGLVGQTTITVAAVGSKAVINIQHLPPLQLILLVSGVFTMEKPRPSSWRPQPFIAMPLRDQHCCNCLLMITIGHRITKTKIFNFYYYFFLSIGRSVGMRYPKWPSSCCCLRFSGTLTMTPGRPLSQLGTRDSNSAELTFIGTGSTNSPRGPWADCEGVFYFHTLVPDP